MKKFVKVVAIIILASLCAYLVYRVLTVDEFTRWDNILLIVILLIGIFRGAVTKYWNKKKGKSISS